MEVGGYFRAVDGVVVVFDVGVRESFESVGHWVKEARVNQNSAKKLGIVIVGNKIDLTDKREVSTQEGQAYAENLGFTFLETSAKESVNVDDAFFTMTNEIRERANLLDDPEGDEDDEFGDEDGQK